MRFPNPIQPNRRPNARPKEAPSASVLEHCLPPDPKAPPRPTVPEPFCGTLPPALPSVLESLGSSRRIGRSR